jgi:hypothetical protein
VYWIASWIAGISLIAAGIVVRFRGQSGHGVLHCKWPLLTDAVEKAGFSVALRSVAVPMRRDRPAVGVEAA